LLAGGTEIPRGAHAGSYPAALALRALTHVALRVPDLRAAEQFYASLLGREPAFREAEVDGAWYTLPAGTGWEEEAAGGARPTMCMIRWDGFAVALVEEDAGGPGGAGLVDHVGLMAEEDDLDRIRRLADELGLRVVHERPGLVTVEDPYGLCWEVSLSGGIASQGERLGNWLDLAAPGME
jgi:catechol 2,3-dioxygenase-like lactoylglutathione lyase family enzyme